MIRKLLIAFALGFAATADAQTTALPPTAEALAADANLFSPSLSPSGRYLAIVVRQDAGDALVVYDLTTSQSATVASARRNNPSAPKLWLNWAQFKTEDRLVFSVSQAVYARGSEVVNAINDGPGLDEYRVPRVLSSDRSGANVKSMFEGQQRRLAVGWASVHLADIFPSDPSTVLLSTLGDEGLTLFKANVETGRTEKFEEGSWDTEDWVLDGEATPVMRVDSLPRNSGYRILRRPPGERRWTTVIEVKQGANINLPDFVPIGAGPGRGKVYVIAVPDGEDRASVYLYDTVTGALGAPLFRHPSVDATGGFLDPATNELQIACATARRRVCTGTDAGTEAHLQALRARFGAGADVRVTDASRNGAKWVVRVSAPDDPGSYVVFDRATGSVTSLGAVYRGLRGARLAPTEIVTYTARDGTELFGYLTRLPGGGARPTVLMPHGGPESRDDYGYDPLVQLFASRGYAVFQPQFRGSLGFGRSFAQAGYRQWGLRMQDDVSDAAKFLTSSGVAEGGKICIVGASYGGYVALAGAALTPDLYKCAASIAGLSDLIAMMDHERQEAGRGSQIYDYWLKVIGNPNADKDALTAASPRRQAARMTAPVLLLHGERDGVVPVDQSKYMRDALQAAGRPARYVEFKDEGHNFYAWEDENQVKLYKELDTFVAAHLGPVAPR